MRLSRETPGTRFDTFTGGVNSPESLTIIFEVMRPPPKAGRDLQDCPSWQAISNTRQDGAGPLRGGTAPRLGPLLACILPIVTSFSENGSAYFSANTWLASAFTLQP